MRKPDHPQDLLRRLIALPEQPGPHLRQPLPGGVAEIVKRHPELGRLRLVVTRSGESDLMTLKAETASPSESLQSELAATLRAVTKLRGNVELVDAGALPNDGKVIADERA